MSDFLVRTGHIGDAERQPTVTCPMCEEQGFVYFSSFRWAGERHLNWSCRACGHVWIIQDRRSNGRI